MDPEVKRRLVHASGALLPALFLLDLLTYGQLQVAYAAGSIVVLGMEAGRLSGYFQWWVFDKLTREYEEGALAGYALYMLSSTFVVFTFPWYVAVPAVLILALADPVSGLLGSGELRQVKRSYVLLVMFGVSTLIASPFVTSLAAIAGGLAATLADGVKPVVAGYVIDDNLTIPPAVAVAIWVALTFQPTPALPG